MDDLFSILVHFVFGVDCLTFKVCTKFKIGVHRLQE
jgi:hypothetical protein